MSDNVWDEELFTKGLEKRKGTLGAEYVEKNLAAADDFTRPFQEAMTAWCWGFAWGDEVIDAKTRSMMNLAMLGALGRMHEWEVHCRGAQSSWPNWQRWCPDPERNLTGPPLCPWVQV